MSVERRYFRRIGGQRSTASSAPTLCALPCAGSTVLDGDTSVGRMTMGVQSPTLECGIGYVRFNEPGDWKGRSLRIKLPTGDVHPCEIVDFPFVDPQKLLVRGLDKTIP